MNLENAQLYNPATNPVLDELLKKANFDYTEIEPKEFINPESGEVVAAILSRNRSDIVLVIAPEKGTSVIYHRKEVGETLTFLGPVVEGTGGGVLLAHKYQADILVDRNRKNDVVNKYDVGSVVTTFPIDEGRGRWRGYHNSDSSRPVAVLIKKRFE